MASRATVTRNRSLFLKVFAILQDGKVDGSTEAKFNEANATLAEGLKTCRAVVSDYRELLETHAPQNDNGEEPEATGEATEA